MDNINCDELIKYAQAYNRMTQYALFFLGTFTGFFLWTLYDRFLKKKYKE